MQSAVSQWRSVARTETGKVRARNEDAFLAMPERGLWVVADGMGGHQNGALASRLIVEQLAELPHECELEERLKHVRKCLHELNRRLGQELTVTAARPDAVIGSTVVALLIDGERAACVWAGDSRCYLWRGSRLYQLTRDHSLAQQLIDEKKLTVEQAKFHPGSHALTRAIGAYEDLQLETIELDVFPNDAFLLCSDGLYQGLSADAISAQLNLSSPHLAISRMFDHVLDGPARDNLSAVLVRQ
ncbi:PP2C family serine/threonine-protein phosphatase [Pseudomonas sp. M30-35]|uniref:PP2C family protein-serine/threonine phosphatase n=1 Tax=Pseudomonas sp. M30-35 TaxID=1981174 RepID=UPI000B3C5848|nr:PP2C family serine/threonine-protein phosphatase [Pseudomonas sp. M30-35]ARU90460.1 protein phosphatase [Pseudomonas sp. M30-35]